LVQGRGLQAACQEIAHVAVCKQQHPAIRVVDYKPFAGAKKFVGDDQRPDGVIARSTASITDHMGVAFGQTSVFCRIKAGIHTGKNREMPTWRQRQVAFVPEILGVFSVRSQHFIQDLGHCLHSRFRDAFPILLVRDSGLRAALHRNTVWGQSEFVRVNRTTSFPSMRS
jgi:hypothetical protein